LVERPAAVAARRQSVIRTGLLAPLEVRDVGGCQSAMTRAWHKWAHQL
jgi:hypothetical protein